MVQGLWRRAFADVPDHVRVELVDMCFQTRVPLAISGFTLAIVAAHMASASGNMWLGVLSAVGAAVTVFRIACDVLYNKRKPRGGFSPAESRRWEYLYGGSSFVFASLIGLLGFVAFRGTSSAHQLLTTALVFGYAAGIVCRISARPAIALPALMMVALPTAVSAIGRIEGSFLFYTVILLAFLLGSFETVSFLYRQTVEQISLKHQFAMLARHDPLTGLANRLGFQEKLILTATRSQGYSELMAVQSIDLDGFKVVNDRYGHPIGDALLQAVAGRLSGMLRDGDFAVRMGGDEFLVVQCAVANRDEAMLLGRRIVKILSEPFAMVDLELTIGASVGIAIGETGDDPSALALAADKALYASKSSGRNCVTFAQPSAVDTIARAG
ncbi:GGDEF domain-containing protein [Tardiphaga alba]|uniref:GGDEF domain-containing protein n=1 Tax=Tardiphaga alba TaxID=340268 RepID=UPI001BAB1444|nr:GGDEF domain-containing protein [Tardiphaga alba]